MRVRWPSGGTAKRQPPLHHLSAATEAPMGSERGCDCVTRGLFQPKGSQSRTTRSVVSSLSRERAVGLTHGMFALLLALLPKCPVCGVTYLSVGGIAALPYMGDWVSAWPVVLLLLASSLVVSARIARRRKRWIPVAIATVGTIVLTGPGLALGNETAMLAGFSLCMGGSLLLSATLPWRQWLPGRAWVVSSKERAAPPTTAPSPLQSMCQSTQKAPSTSFESRTREAILEDLN